ncbi:MAG: hypothetical protein M1835_001185, partial [Candelina submexicana]
MFANLGQSKSNSLANAPPLGGLGAPEPQQQQSNSGQLFGSLGTSTSQPQQQQSTSGGLFGNLGTSTSQSQQQQPTSGSLFGSLGVSQSQQQKSTTGGTFGGSILGTTQSQTSSLFSPPQPQDGQFGQTQQSGQQIEPTTGSSQPAYFDSLLERGRKRTNGVGDSSGFSELPSLQLGLGDIARRVRELGGTGAPSQPRKGTDSKAHYLLAASGISPGSALRDLNSLNNQTAAASGIQTSVAPDTDLETYVANLQSQSTLALIADGLNRSARDFETFLEENVTMEWDAQRRRIYEHFGLASKDGDAQSVNDNPLNVASPGAKGSFGRSARRGRIQNLSSSKAGSTMGGSVFGAAAMQKSVIGTPGSVSNAN